MGVIHDRINLPLKWYIGSYTEWTRVVSLRLREDLDAHIAEILEARRREKELLAQEEIRKAAMAMEEEVEDEE